MSKCKICKNLIHLYKSEDLCINCSHLLFMKRNYENEVNGFEYKMKQLHEENELSIKELEKIKLKLNVYYNKIDV